VVNQTPGDCQLAPPLSLLIRAQGKRNKTHFRAVTWGADAYESALDFDDDRRKKRMSGLFFDSCVKGARR